MRQIVWYKALLEQILFIHVFHQTVKAYNFFSFLNIFCVIIEGCSVVHGELVRIHFILFESC